MSYRRPLFKASDDAFEAITRGDLTLEAIHECWDRVSKNPAKYWKHGFDPDTGESFPLFFCKHRALEFGLAIREAGKSVVVSLLHELGGAGN